MIVDNNSKFGTLVKMMKPFQIIQDKVAIQVRFGVRLGRKDGAHFRNEAGPLGESEMIDKKLLL